MSADKGCYLLLIGLVLRITDYAAGLRCYVCDSEQNTSIPCNRFNSSDGLYVKECLPEEKSCFLNKGRGIISLSCETRKVDDCKVLNFEEFCYCTKDLCNLVSFLPDDEDYEGSGLIPVTSTTKSPQITPTNSSQAKKSYLCLILMLTNFIGF